MEQKSLQEFEKENNVIIKDTMYEDSTKWMSEIDNQPMKNKFFVNNDCFQNCHISLLAVMKMLNHACLGNKKEVMGFLLGKYTKDGYVVIDVEPIPAEASEVSVSINTEQWNYWYETQNLREKEDKKEKLIGWYHSHPGYRPFFSGVDVTTTRLIKNSMQQIGFGIVIDHITTKVSGKLDIGAFNTWHKKIGENNVYNSQKDYKFKLRQGDRVKEFGANCDDYYDMKTTVFKNSTDHALIEVLWNKFWKNTLTRSPIFTEQSQYLKQEQQAQQSIRKAQEDKLNVTTTEGLLSEERKQPFNQGINAALDRNQGVVEEIVKNMLFN